MSEFKGTPGPWRFEEYEDAISEKSVRVVGSNGELICDSEPYYSHSLDPKNGSLIAAAPELLHVANLICTFFDIMEDGPDDSDKEMAHEIFVGAVQKARAAIDKATGAA